MLACTVVIVAIGTSRRESPGPSTTPAIPVREMVVGGQMSRKPPIAVWRYPSAGARPWQTPGHVRGPHQSPPCYATGALTPAQWDDIWILTQEFFDVERDYAEAELRRRQQHRAVPHEWRAARHGVHRHVPGPVPRPHDHRDLHRPRAAARELARAQSAAEAGLAHVPGRRACVIRCGLSTGSSTRSATRATCCCRATSATFWPRHDRPTPRAAGGAHRPAGHADSTARRGGPRRASRCARARNACARPRRR